MKSLLLATACITLVATSACVPASRFEWGNYENTLYAYTKNPAGRPAYKAALVSAIERGRATNRVAPGLLAELGYLQLEDGEREAAIRSFEEEKRVFPEAAVFMTAIISKIRTGSSPAEVREAAMETPS